MRLVDAVVKWVYVSDERVDAGVRGVRLWDRYPYSSLYLER